LNIPEDDADADNNDGDEGQGVLGLRWG
jgi:hypothetical protein